ncbi:response regulator, partial [Breznakia sp. OttesenSCG-928-G09]|nr:response regulator [Breznakia sp. OttesenSCG-928-G09]
MFHVYLVDDNKIIVDKYERLLTKIGEEENIELIIHPFHSGKSLLSFIDDNPMAPIDLVYLDITMDEMSGFEVARQLVNKRADVNIFFLTANEEYLFQTSSNYVVGYLLKNETSDEEFKNSFMLYYTLHNAKQKKIINCVNDNHEKVEVKVKDILYVNLLKLKVVDKDSNVYHLDEDRVLLRDELVKEYFVEVKGVAINLEHIKRIDDSHIIMMNGDSFYADRNDIKKTKVA